MKSWKVEVCIWERHGIADKNVEIVRVNHVLFLSV